MKHVSIALLITAIVAILWAAFLYSVVAFIALDWNWISTAGQDGRFFFLFGWVGGLVAIFFMVVIAYDAVSS